MSHKSLSRHDLHFLRMAKLVSERSKDPSTQAGAVIVASSGEVISTGFNGFPRGMPDLPEYYEDRAEKYSRIVHCEMNALIFARRDLTGATLYTWPLMSCDRCAVHMLQAGITRFVAPANDNPRWQGAFTKVRKYLRECNAELVEVDLSRVPMHA